MTTELRSSTGKTGGGKATWVRVWTLVVVILLLSGCFPTAALIGVREPRLTRIQPGDHRSEAERRLGKRLWRPGSADGVTYDIYEYEPGRLPNPPLAAMALALGLLTSGLAELAFHNERQFYNVKQVAVAYDDQDRVRFVSQPWLISGGASAPPCRRVRSLLPADSRVPSTTRASPKYRQVGFASEIAILELDSEIVDAAIDGGKLEGHVVVLPPGRHTLSYRAVLKGSFIHGDWGMSYSYDHAAAIELLPGRRYRLKHGRFLGCEPATRGHLFWVEDMDSGESIHCSWPTAQRSMS